MFGTMLSLSQSPLAPPHSLLPSVMSQHVSLDSQSNALDIVASFPFLQFYMGKVCQGEARIP